MRKVIHKLSGLTAVLTLIATPALAEMKALGNNTFHYFDAFYSSLVVIGNDSVAVVDPAWTDRANKMKKAIAELTDKTVSHVILTHEHYDHAGGTEVFDGAEIVCHTTCQKFFDLDVTGTVPTKVTLSFENNLSIDLGDKTVDLHHWGSGDGVATTIIHVPDEKVVAIADMYEGPRALTNAMWLEDKNSLGTRAILNRLAKWDLDHVIAGHSASTDPQDLREHAAFHNALYDAVKAALDEAIAKGGASAAFDALGGELPGSIQLPDYADWKGYDAHLAKHVWRMGMSIMHGG